MDSFVLVIADVSSSPTNADELGAALQGFAAACRKEPGCVSYEVFRSLEQPERYVSIEKYVDAGAFVAHRESEHFREIGLGRVMPLTVTRDVQMHTGSNPVPQKAT